MLAECSRFYPSTGEVQDQEFSSIASLRQPGLHETQSQKKKKKANQKAVETHNMTEIEKKAREREREKTEVQIHLLSSRLLGARVGGELLLL